MSALDLWGVDDVAETVYRALLRNPELTVPGLSKHLDLRPRAVRRALDALGEVGLVIRSGEEYLPASPATTLGSLLHSELSELEERRSRLDAVRASLTGFAADHMVGQSRTWSSVPFELLSLDESFAAVEDIQRSTTGEVLSCHEVLDIGADAPSYVELLEAQLGQGRAMRGLYPAKAMDDPARLSYIRHWADAGESVRLMSHALPPIAAFGSEVALVSSTWGGGVVGTLVVRAPALVALVRELFEQYWERALPLSTARVEKDAADDAVLDLLQLGLKDESIARQLGVSLRTVRRRIASLMDELGASTRFQAGVEAARAGLLRIDR